MNDCSDKIVLITGATSGIGHATACAFARRGASIVVAARSPIAGSSVVDELSELGSDARFIRTDVTKESDVEAMVDFSLTEFGRLDYAFNNAGIFVDEPQFHEHDSDTWHEIISTNLTSVYLCMKYEMAAMLESRKGSPEAAAIINNASIIGHRGSSASGLAYATAKHGVIGLTRQAAVNYVNRNIRVNAVSPGPTLTAATRPNLPVPEDELKTRLAALNPTAELVPVDDIAETVVFLCSSAASMINGHDIPLDGGQLAKL